MRWKELVFLAEEIGRGIQVQIPAIRPKRFESENLNFSYTVPAGETYHEIKHSPIDGVIMDVITHFPAGCQGNVGIKVWHGEKQILPTSGWLALDDITQTFPIRRKVRQGDSIRIDWKNDEIFDHKVSVIVSIIGE